MGLPKKKVVQLLRGLPGRGAPRKNGKQGGSTVQFTIEINERKSFLFRLDLTKVAERQGQRNKW